MTSVPARIAASVSASASRSSAGVRGLAALHLDDRAALVAERVDVQRLVLVAAAPDELQLGVVADGLLELAARAQLLERHQVVALEEADEVCRGHDQRAVVMELHRAVTVARGRASSRVTGSASPGGASAHRPKRRPPLDCRRAAASEAPQPHRRARRPPRGSDVGEPRRPADPRGDGGRPVRRPPAPGGAAAGRGRDVRRRVGARVPHAPQRRRRAAVDRGRQGGPGAPGPAGCAAGPRRRGVSDSGASATAEALERLVIQVNAAVARLNAEAPTTRQHRAPLRLDVELARFDDAARADAPERA